ncbi:hypothetical protein CC86DRAFT_113862 [Ophiobolus disseminans]|uniref:Uncharacterized protein n=1 Tax=Ophiobolus disseminans TaxID=1469910 RepID=A0A6A6ZHE7_9PLEO|nr:hypothetical protein CC86DRAFT_113862 [Ophiobolus disseminans]
MSYDLDVTNSTATDPPDDTQLENRGSDTISSPDQASISTLSGPRSICRFPLMALPAELRIMIAEYALYEPAGLFQVWKRFGAGSRVATL